MATIGFKDVGIQVCRIYLTYLNLCKNISQLDGILQ